MKYISRERKSRECIHTRFSYSIRRALQSQSTRAS
jgi:hypothetical protein